METIYKKTTICKKLFMRKDYIKSYDMKMFGKLLNV